MENISRWANANKLLINPTKSKCLVISSQNIDTDSIPKIFIDNNEIEYVDRAKNLGVIFNSKLSWNDHIDSLCGKAFNMLRNLWVTQSFTPLKIKILLVKTFLMPVILYGCELYTNCDQLHKHKLNVLFNNSTRYVYGLKRFDSVSEKAKTIYGITFFKYLDFRVLSFLHKIIYTKTPPYLFSRLRFTLSERNCHIVPLRHSLSSSERQFFIYSVSLWNRLPVSLQRMTNLSTFQHNLLKHFS